MKSGHALLVNPPLVITPPKEKDFWAELLEAVITNDDATGKVLMKQAHENVASLEARRNDASKKIRRHENTINALDAMAKWVDGAPDKIERPSKSIWPLLSSFSFDSYLHLGSDGDAEEIADIISGNPQVFVVEHDWSKAFDGVADFDDGEYALPFDHCCFEFQVSGRAVLVVIKSTEECPHRGAMFFRVGSEWVSGPPGDFGVAPTGSGDDRKLLPLYRGIFRTIKALCIALDAEIVTSEVVRVPSKAKHGRIVSSGVEYRVVRLSRRHRSSPPLNSGTGVRKRLHFRRGHWRHYESHKSWIKWMLVGDPDLGFIDKHYSA